MRFLVRVSLPQRTKSYLGRKQAEINAGRDLDATWTRARRTKTMKGVALTLASMCGKRQRCMFCGDSRSTDIEHFWPKASYRDRTFLWENLLWICTGCNRLKGNRFRLDGRRRPLLIDPTVDDPWDYLFFDASTGNVTAKYDAGTGRPNRKGVYTTDPATLPLNIEAVTEGRQRTRRDLVRAVNTFLNRMATGSGTDPELLEAIQDHDEYGLTLWYFRRDGAADEPFRTLRRSHRGVWDLIERSL